MLLVLPLSILWMLSSGGPTPALREKIEAVLPTAEEERWLQIPWRADLEQARVEARRDRRPLFLWIMNGHPFGCV